jgi:hypothetical protein
MRRNPDLRLSLPAKCLDELRQRWDFTDLGEQIDNLSAQIMAAIAEKERQELKKCVILCEKADGVWLAPGQ